MEESIKITLISAGAVLIGTIIGIFGQGIMNWISHNQTIKKVKLEKFLEVKLKAYKEIVEKLEEMYQVYQNLFNKRSGITKGKNISIRIQTFKNKELNSLNLSYLKKSQEFLNKIEKGEAKQIDMDNLTECMVKLHDKLLEFLLK